MTEPTIIKAKSRRARPKFAEPPEEEMDESRSTDTLTLNIKSRVLDDTPDTGRMIGMIAEAAYYRAERRGFAPGHEIEDWIEAENELRAQMEGA